MARLLINPQSASPTEIPLKPGRNSVGRRDGNDVQIPDPSVSGSHCQIIVEGASATIQDLGSTNGTFINRAPVREAQLQTGQMVHLGNVEMVFYSDGPAPAAVTRPVARVAPRPSGSTPGSAVAVMAAPPPIPVAGGAPTGAVTYAPSDSAPEPASMLVAQACKSHPKTLGRYYCSQCQHFHCELCVTSRSVAGMAKKFCRKCGMELLAAQVSEVHASASGGFFSRLAGAFVYPFKGSGPLVLIVSTIVFAALSFISGGLFGLIISVIAVGYLFSFMQAIIFATASDDPEMPGMPDFDGLFGAFFRLASAVMFSFGPAIGLGIYALVTEETTAAIAMIAAMLFGSVYFPMALLAVAIKDSALAANPLLVVPSMFKVAPHYVVAVVLSGAVYGLHLLGQVLIAALFPEGIETKSVGTLLGMAGVRAFWAFAGIYLLAVNMRILGLLYLINQRKLGWIGR